MQIRGVSNFFTKISNQPVCYVAYLTLLTPTQNFVTPIFEGRFKISLFSGEIIDSGQGEIRLNDTIRHLEYKMIASPKLHSIRFQFSLWNTVSTPSDELFCNFNTTSSQYNAWPAELDCVHESLNITYATSGKPDSFGAIIVAYAKIRIQQKYWLNIRLRTAAWKNAYLKNV